MKKKIIKIVVYFSSQSERAACVDSCAHTLHERTQQVVVVVLSQVLSERTQWVVVVVLSQVLSERTQ